MLNKLNQWIALNEIVDQHSDNAMAALHAVDRTDKIVNRHLLRIARRESDISDFALYMSESKAFDIDLKD